MLRVGVTQFLPMARDEKSGLLSLLSQDFFSCERHGFDLRSHRLGRGVFNNTMMLAKVK